jgi:hypothetical protein
LWPTWRIDIGEKESTFSIFKISVRSYSITDEFPAPLYGSRKLLFLIGIEMHKMDVGLGASIDSRGASEAASGK